MGAGRAGHKAKGHRRWRLRNCEVRVMQDAETVLAVLRERGRKGLPCDEVYRQLFNKELYLLAYGRIYANQGAMTPGASAETADGMSEAKIDQIIEAMRHERYRFARPGGCSSRRRTGKCARSACRRGQTSWSVRWCASCWRHTMSRSFLTAHTGSGNGADVIPRCGRFSAPGPDRMVHRGRHRRLLGCMVTLLLWLIVGFRRARLGGWNLDTQAF